jgi:GTP pyrophosphokinase
MFEIDVIIDKYIQELKKSYNDFERDFDKIKKAIDFAKIAHEGQIRKYSGKPFIVHPLRVAIMVAQKCDNLSLILAAILHDTVEDSPDKVSMQKIYEEFGDDV